MSDLVFSSESGGITLMRGCYTSTGSTLVPVIELRNIDYFGNFSGDYFRFGSKRTDIIYDLDGSFTGYDEFTTVVTNFAYLRDEQNCTTPTGNQWHYALHCSSDVKVFIAGIYANAYYGGIRVAKMDNLTTSPTNYQTFYTGNYYYYMPMVSGSIYHFYWANRDINYV